MATERVARALADSSALASWLEAERAVDALVITASSSSQG